MVDILHTVGNVPAIISIAQRSEILSSAPNRILFEGELTSKSFIVPFLPQSAFHPWYLSGLPASLDEQRTVSGPGSP
jgi:hypothetical protein